MSGVSLKAIGQATTLEAEREEWTKTFVQAFNNWSQGREAFYLCDFREWWATAGGRDPHHPNVWGAMTKYLKANGYRMTGLYRQSSRPSAHARIVFEWARV